ncbi:DUF3991 and TOPRIM domain-containing protein [Paenibacillus sp. Soil522]|uniref:DUF3991 and TOPRIM domain-containing protein n=1 Tax=Paenibacillus sp. Soil522 TaxID=1736388 RepID=UPI000701D9B0|nr:DUF3991 and TOPRIM domain-containing protein [Paenibacillus sp. Soil522]KRE29654.1 hypothetical protein ASG81_25475 [Paenibacillus sp. Soil522]
MAYTKEQVKLARQANLVSFCENEGIHLIDAGGGDWKLPNRHGLLIKNNYYYVHGSKETGYAIDFCINILELEFKVAMEKLLKCPTFIEQDDSTRLRRVKAKQEKKAEFVLPESKAKDSIFAYLRNKREIPMYWIRELMKKRLLYQDEHKNCVFPCYDFFGNPKGAILRGTSDKQIFKGRSLGSDANYGWVVKPEGNSDKVIVFEAPIDAMSYLVFHPSSKDNYLLSLGGLNMSTLQTFLKEYNQISSIVLALDNDEPAKVAINGFRAEYGDKYKIEEVMPSNKDWNEDLRRK